MAPLLSVSLKRRHYYTERGRHDSCDVWGRGDLVRKNTGGCGVAVLVLGSVLGSAIEGQAANLEVQFIDMTNNLLATCRDNAACDSAGAVGTIIFNLAVAGASAEGVATAAPGPFGLALLFDVGGAAANSFRIAVLEDNLSGSSLVWSGCLGWSPCGAHATQFA